MDIQSAMGFVRQAPIQPENADGVKGRPKLPKKRICKPLVADLSYRLWKYLHALKAAIPHVKH